MFSKLKIIFIISFALFLSFAVAPQYVFARPPISSGFAGAISIPSDYWIAADDLPSAFLGYLEATGFLVPPVAGKTTEQKEFAQQQAVDNLNTYAVNNFVSLVPYSDDGNQFEPDGNTAILYCLFGGAPYICGSGGPPPYLKFSSPGWKYPSLWVLAQGSGGALSVYMSSLTAYITDNEPPEIVQFVMPSTYNSRTVPITLVATDLDSGNDGDIAFYSFTEEFVEDMKDIVWQTYVQGVTQYQYTFSSWGANTLYAWLRDADGGINLNVPSGFSSYQSIYDPAYFYDDNPIGSVVIIDPDADNDTPNWLYDTATFECGLDNHPCMLNDWFGNPYPPISAKIYGVDINGDGFYDDEVWLFDSSVVGTGIEITLAPAGGIAGLGQFVATCKMSLSGITKCPSGVPPEEGEKEIPIPAISLSHSSGIVEFQSPLPGEVGQEICIIPPPEYPDAEIYYTVYTTTPTTPTVSPANRYITGECFDVSDFTTLSQNATVVAMAVVRPPSGPIKITEEKEKLEKDGGFLDRFKSIFKRNEDNGKKDKSSKDSVSQSNTFIGFKNTLKNIIKKAFAANDYQQSGYALMTYDEIVNVPPRPLPPTITPGRRYYPIDSEVHVYLSYPSDPDVTLWYDKDAYDDDFSFTQYISPIVITSSKTIAVHARKFDPFSGQTIEGYTRYRAFSLGMDVPSERNYLSPGNYQFTVPAENIGPFIDLTVVGGGGGGGGSGFWNKGGDSKDYADGGSGGAASKQITGLLEIGQDINPGDVLGIEVGTGGAGGPQMELFGGQWGIDYNKSRNYTSGDADGADGTESTIALNGVNFLTANGGGGGQGVYKTDIPGSPIIAAGVGGTALGYFIHTDWSDVFSWSAGGSGFPGVESGRMDVADRLIGDSYGGDGGGYYGFPGGKGGTDSGEIPKNDKGSAQTNGEVGSSGSGGGGGSLAYYWIGWVSAWEYIGDTIFLDQQANVHGNGGKGGDGYVILDWDWLFVGTP